MGPFPYLVDQVGNVETTRRYVASEEKSPHLCLWKQVIYVIWAKECRARKQGPITDGVFECQDRTFIVGLRFDFERTRREQLSI